MAGIYYTASSASSDDGSQSVTHLSSPIDLTERPYEIGLVYCSVLSSWLYSDDLRIYHSSLETGNTEFIRFESIPYTRESESLWLLATKLSDEYGSNMVTAPIKIFRDSGTFEWKLRLAKLSMADISSDLAFMLGVNTTLENKTDKVKDFPIVFHAFSPTLDKNLFFLSCHQTAQNFTNNTGANNRIIGFIHPPIADSYAESDFTTARLGYVPLEGNLLNRISFSLLNHQGKPVQTNKFHFVVVFHIRPVQND